MDRTVVDCIVQLRLKCRGLCTHASDCSNHRSHPTWPYPLVEYFSKARKCSACTLNQVISALRFSKNDGRIDTSREKQLSWLLSDSSPMHCLIDIHCTGFTNSIFTLSSLENLDVT